MTNRAHPELRNYYIYPRIISTTDLEMGESMPRYLVEQTFPDTLEIPITSDGTRTFQTMITANMEDGVTWLHSYVSVDKRKAFCIVDGPSPEAIRRVAKRNRLPVDKITEVSVLDPYFYR